ncbi:MAG TPA: holo-ACP synthase [Candidatus Izemoplasmatales bacterium]|nr:holo-ACP synthase [Candidatus Izemoplasmatales bacterium]
MIKGIGVDICQINRVKLSLDKKILSDEEQVIFDQIKLESRKREFLAGRFSAKEALLKALTGTLDQLFMKDIVIIYDVNHKPMVKEPVLKNMNIHVSIAHEKDYAVSQVIVEVE